VTPPPLSDRDTRRGSLGHAWLDHLLVKLGSRAQPGGPPSRGADMFSWLASSSRELIFISPQAVRKKSANVREQPSRANCADLARGQ
jgi:hypothetical protein